MSTDPCPISVVVVDDESLVASSLSTLLALIASLLGYAGVQTVEDY